MAALTQAEIESILALGSEIRTLEVKGPGLCEKSDPLFAKVVRAVLSMANLRDGGSVIIGIDDTQLATMQPGLSEDELASWSDADTVCRLIREYSDPFVEISVSAMSLTSGADIVQLAVDEFSSTPVFCKKDLGSGLQRGGLYVRSKTVAETTLIQSSVEMTELIDLASDKLLREYVAKANRSDVKLSVDDVLGADASSDEASQDKFDAQRSNAW
jgi:predicted HTH transcriptional regulator